MNDGISKQLSIMSYVSVDEVVDRMQLGGHYCASSLTVHSSVYSVCLTQRPHQISSGGLNSVTGMGYL